MKSNHPNYLRAQIVPAVIASFWILVGSALAADKPVQPPYSWRGINGQGVFPAGDLVTEFWDIPAGWTVPEDIDKFGAKTIKIEPGTQKNIVWRSLLPNWGNSSPVAMGDRVFVLCDEGWKSDAPELVCLSAIDGKILWQQPVDHLDAWPKDKREDAKAVRARDLKRWREHMTWWNRFYWDNNTNKGIKLDEATYNKLLAEALADGWIFCPYDQVKGPGLAGRGRHGRGDGRGMNGAGPVDRSRLDDWKRCQQERIHCREGWTTYDSSWYGSTMGSAVGDGERIYAVTAFGGAAAFDLDGHRLWVADLPNPPTLGTPHMDGLGQGSISSPVLADGKLIYFAREIGVMYGVDCQTGALAWETKNPPRTEEEGDETYYCGKMGHMAPGGTPVVMRLPVASDGNRHETVVISGNGFVVRVSDGKALGMFRFEPPADAIEGKAKKTKKGKNAFVPYSDTYHSWVAFGDVLYATHFRGHLCAKKLSIENDMLKQDPLWWGQVKGDNRNPSLVFADGLLYWAKAHKEGEEKTGGSYNCLAMDGNTGEIRQTAPRGIVGGSYVTTFAVTRDRVIARTGNWHYRDLRMPVYTSFAVSDREKLELIGEGLLVEPPITNEVMARHIARNGISYHVWGVSSPIPWGNRIFIRSNDYLWCIGDPKAAWVPPEKYLVKK